MKTKLFKRLNICKVALLAFMIASAVLFVGCTGSDEGKSDSSAQVSAEEETAMLTEKTTLLTTSAKKKTTTTIAATTVTTSVTTTATTVATTTATTTSTTAATQATAPPPTAAVTTAVTSAPTIVNTEPIVATAAPTTTTNVTSNADFPYDNNTYEFMSEVVRLCNVERAAEGLAALTLDPTLTKAAMTRAAETVTLFDHTRPDGTLFYTVLSEVGFQYRAVGENIAAGQTTPAGVVSSWMNSPGHRANILNESFNKIGVGYVCAPGDAYYHYWVQIFAD